LLYNYTTKRYIGFMSQTQKDLSVIYFYANNSYNNIIIFAKPLRTRRSIDDYIYIADNGSSGTVEVYLRYTHTRYEDYEDEPAGSCHSI